MLSRGIYYFKAGIVYQLQIKNNYDEISWIPYRIESGEMEPEILHTDY